MQAIKDILARDTIVIDEPALRHGFTVVPNYLFSLKTLSHGARLTYILLLKYAWQEGSCFPGVITLAAGLEVERKAVMRYTQELVCRGLISIERRGQGKTNVYHLNRWSEQPESRAEGRAQTDRPPEISGSRSPMHGTSGSTLDGIPRSPADGTRIILSGQRSRERIYGVGAQAENQAASRQNDHKDANHVSYLVEEILKVCGDRESTPFYRHVAHQLDDHHIFRMLSEIRQDDSIRNRGAVFTSKVQALEEGRHHPGGAQV